jgi:hypothetical protein
VTAITPLKFADVHSAMPSGLLASVRMGSQLGQPCERNFYNGGRKRAISFDRWKMMMMVRVVQESKTYGLELYYGADHAGAQRAGLMGSCVAEILGISGRHSSFGDSILVWVIVVMYRRFLARVL